MKYKIIFYNNPNKENANVIGEFKTKKEAINAALSFANDKCLYASNQIENDDIVRTALEERGYYLFLNPWEFIIEEL